MEKKNSKNVLIVMGSRINQMLIEANMGSSKSKGKIDQENNGENQNLNQVTTEIKNTIEVNHDKVELYLIIIIVLLVILTIYFIYSEINKRSKKKYSAPRPGA